MPLVADGRVRGVQTRLSRQRAVKHQAPSVLFGLRQSAVGVERQNGYPNLMAPVKEPELERQSRRLAVPGSRFMLIAALMAAPGVVLIVLGSGWVWALGIALVALALAPTAVALGLLGSAGVARWASRERPFA